MNISNKIALVTGSSRGLGRNMALQLARNGADVVVTWRSRKDEAASVCAEIEELGRKSAHLQLDAAVISSFSSFCCEPGSVIRFSPCSGILTGAARRLQRLSEKFCAGGAGAVVPPNHPFRQTLLLR